MTTSCFTENQSDSLVCLSVLISSVKPSVVTSLENHAQYEFSSKS
jgi:hypothetical protein